MPNRIVREGILHSERVNALSCEAENFYRRLLSVVDDFGRYYAKPELLRSACYPLKIDQVTNSDIDSHLKECATHMLIKCYQVENTKYLEVLDFRQQVRAKKSKYPCASDATHVPEDDHLDGDGDEDDKGASPRDYIWTKGLTFDGVTRELLGKLVKDHGEDVVAKAIARTLEHAPADPKTFLLGCVKKKSSAPKVWS